MKQDFNGKHFASTLAVVLCSSPYFAFWNLYENKYFCHRWEKNATRPL